MVRGDPVTLHLSLIVGGGEGGECEVFELVALWKCHFGRLDGGDESSAFH